MEVIVAEVQPTGSLQLRNRDEIDRSGWYRVPFGCAGWTHCHPIFVHEVAIFTASGRKF